MHIAPRSTSTAICIPSGQSNSVNNLAKVFKLRYERSGQCEDLEETISLQQDSLKLRPAPSLIGLPPSAILLLR
jgi:hypothetical protein